MKIAIIGAGGVGGYFGAQLVRAGYDVTFLARGAHLNAIKTKGLIIHSMLGDFRVHDIQATDDMGEIHHPDLVILGIKAWQIKEMRDALKKMMHADSMILPLQNGVMAAEELMEVIEKTHVLGGLCRIISKIEAPGVINHVGATPEIVFGEPDKSVSERISKLKTLFDKAGIEARISYDIEADLWKKFIFICVGGLLALTNKTCGELRELDESRHMMMDLLNEIFELAQASRVNIAPEVVSKTAAFIDSLPYDTTFSLTRDVWEGRPSEIEYQNGAVVHLAEKLGVDVPINRLVYEGILPQERKARGLKL